MRYRARSPIDGAVIKTIADLVRLDLPVADAKVVSVEVGKLLKEFEKLDELDLGDIEPDFLSRRDDR